MPRQGGQGKGKPKLSERGLGRALIRNRQQTAAQRFSGRKKEMGSLLDNTGGLEEYIETVDMEGEDVEVHRVHRNDAFLVQPTVRSVVKQTTEQFDFCHVQIPRKPEWNTKMTAEEVDRNEKDAFLEWRRDIAAMEVSEDGIRKVTPFEKNIEVWRQLWRVIERCDMAIQIVDARNPLLYFTSDLMLYASEQEPPRPVLLIVNKADFLTEHQRRVWGETFQKLGIKFVYYSAKIEQDKLDTASDEELSRQEAEIDVDLIDALADGKILKAILTLQIF